MKKLTHCKKCKKQFEIWRSYRMCTNLGCIEYNKPIGAKVVRKKIQKSQEEEE
jgi:hypothetical protein